MKANEIEVGKVYRAKVSGRFTDVRVDEIGEIRKYAGKDYYSGQVKTREAKVYHVTNLTTGRKLTFKSAAKFRCVAPV